MSSSLQNFAYVSSYLHLNSFAWKQDCKLCSKLQRHEVDQDSSRKII